MPADLRKQYLIDLRTKYAANARMLGAMFGVNNQTVLNQQKELGIPPMSRGAHASRTTRARWQAFCDGTAEETACQEQAAEDATKAEEPVEPTPEETTERMTLDCFTACITGRYSPEAMLAILGTMPIPEGKCNGAWCKKQSVCEGCLVEWLKQPAPDEPCGGCHMVREIADAPTIDPEELRPKGRWEITEYPLTKTKKLSCSNCGYSENRGPSWDKSWGTPRFCQGCGANMMEVT